MNLTETTMYAVGTDKNEFKNFQFESSDDDSDKTELIGSKFL